MTEQDRKIQLKASQNIREQLRDIMKHLEQVREQAALIPSLKNSLSTGTQDIGEMIIDMIYLLCDFIGSQDQQGGKE